MSFTELNRLLVSHTATLVKLTNAFEDHMEEGDNRPVDKTVELVNKGLFDHLVPRNIHHPLASSSQAEHWAILQRKLQSQSHRFGINIYNECIFLSLLLTNQGEKCLNW